LLRVPSLRLQSCMASLLKKIRAASFAEPGDEAARDAAGASVGRSPPPVAEASHAETAKRFRAEALALSVALSAPAEDCNLCAAAVTEALTAWERRLAAATQETAAPAVANSTLRAFLHSRALEVTLEAVFGSGSFNAVLHKAASAVMALPDAMAQEAHGSSEGEALARLLLRTSTASPAVLSELLLLLAGASRTAERCRSGLLSARGIEAEEDSRWVMRLMTATFIDGDEADVLEVSRACDSMEQALTAARASLSEDILDCHDRRATLKKLPAGGEVWACWPGDGYWYRASVKSSTKRRVQVAWLSPPAEAAEELDASEYVAGSASEGGMPFGELGRSAVLPVAEAARRPAPASAGGEGDERWGRLLSVLEEYDMHFRELRSLCSEIERLRRSGAAAAGPPEQQPPLSGAATTMSAFRAEAEERAESLGCVAALSSSKAKGLQEAIARSTGAAASELQAVRTERLQMAARVDTARARREELERQLRELGEELSAAEAALGVLREREEQLAAEEVHATEELVRSCQAAREHADIAAEQQEVLTRAAVASQVVEKQLASRAAAVAGVAALRETFGCREQAMRATCVASNRAQRRALQELLAAWYDCIWGPEAAVVAKNAEQIDKLRSLHRQVLRIVDAALQAAEDSALPEKAKAGGSGVLESLFGQGHAESDDESDDDAVAGCMSRVAPKYKRMRHQLSKNLERLAEMEASAPIVEKALAAASGPPSGLFAEQLGRQEVTLFSGSPAA